MGTQEIVEVGYLFLFCILVIFMWIQGLYGLCAGEKIMLTYGSLISRGWGLLRSVRTLLNGMMFAMVLYTYGWIAGEYPTPYTFENVCWCLVTLGLNLLIIHADKKRFPCDKKLARRIARNERCYACSIITRISLIVFISSMAAMYVFTDTSEYYRGRDGNIYRCRDTLSI